jgi:hypothetical protein
MATVNPTMQRIGNGSLLIRWALTNADFDGAPIGDNLGDYFDRSVQVVGSFGGATVVIQGSNNGNDWYALDDPQGGDLSFAAPGGKAITEVPQFTRPLLVGGAASSVTVSVFARRARSGRAV